ncbi:MAG: sodium:calcium antiporter [Candidatus Portiera sp.]|nr:sodium:calcium antiporter [Portiera sp.]
MFSSLVNSLILLGVGIGILVGGAELLIRQVQYLATRYNIPPFILGAVILGFGTSLPEVVVSIFAVINETPLIAYGNAIGSNLLNIGLVLGLAACVSSVPLVMRAKDTKVSFIFLGLSVLSVTIFASDMNLMPYEALISLALFGYCMYLLLTTSPPASSPNKVTPRNPYLVTLLTLLGFGMVGYGGELTVYNAGAFAYEVGVSEQVVSLVILAFGTSLPEMVVTLQLALKKETDIIIGNLLGSNIFNVLLVLPIAYLFQPLHISWTDLYRDGAFLIGLTSILIFIGFAWRGERTLHKKGGVLLLGIYCAYLGLIAHSVFIA